MDTRLSSVAVLLFAHSSKETEYRKPLFKGQKINSKFHKELANKICTTLKQSDIPVYVFNECKQIGNNFGERISNSIEAVFSKGYSKVIVIGNDCPELNHNDLVKAKRLLDEHNDCVIGPDERGGAYLIGLSKKAFTRENFENLSWQSSGMANSLREYIIQSEGSVKYLVQKFDLNESFDIKRYLAKSLWLFKVLINLFVERFIGALYSLIYSYSFYLQASRRGPPVLA